MLEMAVICFDIGGTHIKSGIYSRGKFVEKKEINSFTKSVKTKSDFLSQFDSLMQYYLKKYSSFKFESVNIGMLGPFKDLKKGILGEKLKNLPLAGFNFKNYVEKKYKLMCLIDNDANCFVLGETYFGKAKGAKNVVGITLGTGTGFGIVIDGAVYNGKGTAGELSKLKYKHGTLEDYVSARGILRIAKKHGFNVADSKELAFKKYAKVWREFGEDFGFALSVVVLAFDPEVIVVGGEIARSSEFFEKQAKKIAEKLVPFKIGKIVYSKRNLALQGALKIK